jgi:hypothetical protein
MRKIIDFNIENSQKSWISMKKIKKIQFYRYRFKNYIFFYTYTYTSLFFFFFLVFFAHRSVISVGTSCDIIDLAIVKNKNNKNCTVCRGRPASVSVANKLILK